MLQQILNTDFLIDNILINNNNKRLSDEYLESETQSQSISTKRICNNDRQLNEFNENIEDNNDDNDINVYHLNCMLNNVRLNHKECPEWPTDWITECSTGFTKLLNDENNGMFPPIVGEIYFRFKLEKCLKRGRRTAVFEACDHTNVNDKFVVKIGIAKGAKLLNNEYYTYKLMENNCSQLVPKITDKLYKYRFLLIDFLYICII
jgi:hypothetical protein